MTNSNVQPATADSLARLYTPEAMGTLVQVMRGEIVGRDAQQRMTAAQTILDRGHGRAVQATISLPATRKRLEQLASLDDSALMQIAMRGRQRDEAKGGGGEQNGGPVPPGSAAGTHQRNADPSRHPESAHTDPLNPSGPRDLSSGNYARNATADDYELPVDGSAPLTPPPPKPRSQHRLPFGHGEVQDAETIDASDL